MDDTDEVPDGDSASDGEETLRVWLVERTYSDDEQNIVILIYATPEGERYVRKERALTSFTDVRDTTAAVEAPPRNLGRVEDEETRERYATEARRMAASHDPDDVSDRRLGAVISPRRSPTASRERARARRRQRRPRPRTPGARRYRTRPPEPSPRRRRTSL